MFNERVYEEAVSCVLSCGLFWKILIIQHRLMCCLGASGSKWEDSVLAVVRTDCGSWGLSESVSSSVTRMIMHTICMKIKIFKARYTKLIFVLFVFEFFPLGFEWKGFGLNMIWINHIPYFIAHYHYWSVRFIIWLDLLIQIPFLSRIAFHHVRNHPNIIYLLFCFVKCVSFLWPFKRYFCSYL